MEKKVLVVDDELPMREMLYDLLSRKGYKVVIAPGGQEAIEMTRRENPDLVLLDINMPKLNGIESLKKIRKFDNKTKIIMLTSMEDIESERQARLAGASGFLRKSLGISLISKAVNDVLVEKPELDDEEKKKILVVDDDPQICTLLKDFLNKKGYNPITANNGEEALEKLRKEKPVIVLLDMVMPGMDGLMTLKRIKEIDERIGIIMTTGIKDKHIAELALELGAYDYVIKPFDLDYLEMCLFTKILLLTT